MNINLVNTDAERFAVILFYKLYGSVPRPGTDFHKYSHGATVHNLRITYTQNSIVVELSRGVPYSTYEFGFNEDGSRRSPRGKRERYNFKIVDRCLKSTANIIASLTGGKVIYD